MATDITMPKLSDTMTEGRLISWKKSVGDQVERGDVIARWKRTRRIWNWSRSVPASCWSSG